MSVPHHDGLFVNMVDYGLDEEIDGIAIDFAMWLKEVTPGCIGQNNKGSEMVIRIDAKGE